jgi:hypothetical protein
MGLVVEKEHVDTWTENEVVQTIAKLIAEKISRDHLTEKSHYYSIGDSFDFFDELGKRKKG